MQVQATKLTLFDYINNSSTADAALEGLAARQKQDVGSDVRSLQREISTGDVDTTLEQLQSGETSLNLQTLDNMLNFNMLPIAKDLQQVAKDLGIKDPVEIKNIDGQWQVQNQASADNRATQQLQTYLDHNKALQTKLDTLNKLSELVELGASQQYAKQLQEANISEPDVVTYLTQAREYLFALDSFTLSYQQFNITSRGEAEGFFNEVTNTLGLTDKEG
jgi:hypothetical protein